MDEKTRRPRRTPARPKATSKAKIRKSAVVIAGMHRSGTSVVARTLSLLGCALPQTLVGPSRNNERGYWESRVVLNLNDEILASAGSSWDDWEPVNPAWLRSPIAAEFRDRAQDVLSCEFGTATLFVLKDPRISRLLPFWIDALEAFGATPLIVCPLRNPLEVAASLEARNQMEPSIGHLLWLRHLLDAEAASRGRRRAFVRYDDFIECWQEVADRLSVNLEVAWPQRSRTADLEMQEFLQQSLRHHVREDASVLKNSSLSEWIRSSFDILNRWTKDDVRDTDAAELERIKSDFDSAAMAFRHPVAVGRAAAQAANRLQGTLDKRDTTIDALTQKLDAEKERTGKQAARLDERDAEVDELRKKVEARDGELAALTQKLDAEKERTGKQAARLDERDAEVDELRKKVEARDLAALTQTLDAEKARASELAARVEKGEQLAGELRAAQEKLRIIAKAAAENDKVVADQRELSEMMSTALREKRTAYAALETAIIAKYS